MDDPMVRAEFLSFIKFLSVMLAWETIKFLWQKTLRLTVVGQAACKAASPTAQNRIDPLFDTWFDGDSSR